MRELRIAVRSLVRQPGMAALAVVALGLGIGLTTTMFSIVNGAVLRGLPFPESDRIAALFLATVGLYGVMAFSDSRRTQEIGVRIAMGARSRDILTMVMRQGAWQVGIGLALGAGLGVALGSASTLLLYRVSPFEPLILVLIAGVLAVTTLLACLVPARRAAAVDPMTALRYQ